LTDANGERVGDGAGVADSNEQFAVVMLLGGGLQGEIGPSFVAFTTP